MKNTSIIILTGFLTFSLIRAEITADTHNKPNWLIKSDIINQNVLFAQSDLKSGKDDHPFPYQILYRINLKSHTDFGVGVAVVFDSLLWVSAGGRTQLTEPNWIFIYNLNNQNLVDSFIQPTSIEDWGWRDMCFDGQYVWGSDQGQIDKIDPHTYSVVSSINPGTGLNLHRGLATDYDSLYANSWDSPFWKFSFAGANAHSYPNLYSDTIYGIAYDRHGFFWVSSQNVTGNRCGKYTTNFNLIEEHAIAEIPGIAGGVEMWQDSILMYLSQADTDQVFAIQLYGVNGVVNDVGVDVIHAPPVVIDPGAIVTPMCRVRNFGSAHQTGVPVTCWIDSAGTIVYYSSTYINIGPGDTVQATISPDWVVGPSGNTYVVTMFTALSGDENMCNDTLRRISTTVDISEEGVNKTVNQLLGKITPNPIRDFAQIHFSLTQRESILLEIYDLKGTLVRTLITRTIGPGDHYVNWDGSNKKGARVANGAYLYRLTMAGKSALGKAIILK